MKTRSYIPLLRRRIKAQIESIENHDPRRIHAKKPVLDLRKKLFLFISILFYLPLPNYPSHCLDFYRNRLVSTTGLGDDALELIDLSLGTAKGTEPLLGQLTGTLVLAVAEKFDNTTLIGSEAV